MPGAVDLGSCLLPCAALSTLMSFASCWWLGIWPSKPQFGVVRLLESRKNANQRPQWPQLPLPIPDWIFPNLPSVCPPQISNGVYARRYTAVQLHVPEAHPHLPLGKDRRPLLACSRAHTAAAVSTPLCLSRPWTLTGQSICQTSTFRISPRGLHQILQFWISQSEFHSSSYTTILSSPIQWCFARADYFCLFAPKVLHALLFQKPRSRSCHGEWAQPPAFHMPVHLAIFLIRLFPHPIWYPSLVHSSYWMWFLCSLSPPLCLFPFGDWNQPTNTKLWFVDTGAWRPVFPRIYTDCLAAWSTYPGNRSLLLVLYPSLSYCHFCYYCCFFNFSAYGTGLRDLVIPLKTSPDNNTQCSPSVHDRPSCRPSPTVLAY